MSVHVLAVAVLVLQAGSARAGIVAADLLLDTDRRIGLLLTVRAQVLALSTHLAHVRAAGRRLGRTGLVLVTQRDEGAEQERQGALVQLLQHRCEEVVALELVDHQRVLLLIGSVLHALAQVVHITQVLRSILRNMESKSMQKKTKRGGVELLNKTYKSI